MKGGSEVQFTTSLQLDPLDWLDWLDLVACAKVVFCVRETLLYVLETRKSLYCVFKKYKVYFRVKKAPAGMLGGAPSMSLGLEDTKRAYFMSLRHKNRDSVFQKNITSYFGKIKAPAGMLGGAPSMFLCLGDIESASFMSHLCPQGSNEAYFMSSRYKN